MDDETVYLACLLECGLPEWIRFSQKRNCPIVDTVYRVRVECWWEFAFQREPDYLTHCSGFIDWWLKYKAWIRHEKIMSDRKEWKSAAQILDGR